LLLQAGLPENVAQFIHCGDPAIIQTLVANEEIDVVSFTGSVQGGIAIQKAAAERTIPVILELGGKDPAYVRSDVDVAYTAAEIVDGAVFNSGQSCCAIERVYVHESVHDQFVEEVKKVLQGYNVGDPRKPETLLGPVVSKASVERVAAQVKDAVEKGAKVETPQGVFTETALGGWFVRPELLVGCNHDMGMSFDILAPSLTAAN
jgi:acyl-CoA reductase-like NAD-dependent aldehyde dehydrogenase